MAVIKRHANTVALPSGDDKLLRLFALARPNGPVPLDLSRSPLYPVCIENPLPKTKKYSYKKTKKESPSLETIHTLLSKSYSEDVFFIIS